MSVKVFKTKMHLCLQVKWSLGNVCIGLTLISNFTSEIEVHEPVDGTLFNEQLVQSNAKTDE